MIALPIAQAAVPRGIGLLEWLRGLATWRRPRRPPPPPALRGGGRPPAARGSGGASAISTRGSGPTAS